MKQIQASDSPLPTLPEQPTCTNVSFNKRYK